MTREDQKAIIEQVKAGDRNAFALLVNEYAGAVFNLAFRMTASRDDANDLTQDAFMRGYQSLGSFDADRRFFPWIYTIALNGIRNHLRRRKNTLLPDGGDLPTHQPISEGAGPEQTLMDRQEAAKVSRSLQKLPLKLREAIVLRYYQDLPFEEIAAILGISSSGAKMRVYRGLEKLKLLLAGDQ